MATTSGLQPPRSTIPYRQIRAEYDDESITVYQAYSAAIAIPAVREQKLSASPEFKPGRMTWIKPSWCWMMYRSGYSFKDERQAHILALKMKHAHFLELLSGASLSHGGILSDQEKEKPVRVQWDPERSPSLGVLPYRSIQIGISREMSKRWVEDWIISIEDVTEKAKELKKLINDEPTQTLEELVQKGIMPNEKVYEVPEDIRKVLKMDLISAESRVESSYRSILEIND